MVENPVEELRKLLDDPYESERLVARALVRQYEQEFMDKHEIRLKFSDKAIDPVRKLDIKLFIIFKVDQG